MISPEVGADFLRFSSEWYAMILGEKDPKGFENL
jgi:hypothetical protein